MVVADDDLLFSNDAPRERAFDFDAEGDLVKVNVGDPGLGVLGHGKFLSVNVIGYFLDPRRYFPSVEGANPSFSYEFSQIGDRIFPSPPDPSPADKKKRHQRERGVIAMLTKSEHKC